MEADKDRELVLAVDGHELFKIQLTGFPKGPSG